MTFEPSDAFKTIKIFSTIRLTSHNDDSCPIKLVFNETQRSSVALDTCTGCLTDAHFGEDNAFELNVTRTSFDNGIQDRTLIHIEVIPSDSLAADWKSSKDDVMVRDDVFVTK